jgi:integrase
MSAEKIESGNAQDSSEIISAARRLLSLLPATDTSPETERTYRQELSRLIKKTRSPDQPESASPDRFWAAVCNTRSKNTYYRRVASVKYGLRTMLEGALLTEKVETLRFLIELKGKVDEAHGGCPISFPKRRHSKRQDIRGLPADWREAMLSEMKKTPHYLPSLVLACVGCRPEELSEGVRVVAARNEITLDIKGAKVKKDQGQPSRQVVYEINQNSHPLVLALHNKIWEEGVLVGDSREMMVRLAGKKSGFTSAIRAAGRKLWPRRKREITPYCFRHSAASDFKEHLDGDDVSAAVGHCVDATKSRYGQRQMSSGGLRPSSVKADRPIRPTSSSPKSKVKKRSNKI